MCLLVVLDSLHFTCVDPTQPQRGCPGSPHINPLGSVNHSCEVSVLVYDVDTVVGTVRRQDVTPAVCGDAVWTE